MSEFQYYEFRAVDRRLTVKEMAALRRITSRAEITPTRLVNSYSYGSFRGEPVKLVAKYFDAFLYMTNWGARTLMVKLPADCVDRRTAAALASDTSAAPAKGKGHVIVHFEAPCDTDMDRWVESTGEVLEELLPLRDELIAGDTRALYAGWLAGVMDERVDEGALEPPVPAGLGDPSPALQALIDFLFIDPHLFAAAAERSPKLPARAQRKRAAMEWVTRLSDTRRDTLLANLLVDGAPQELAKLRKQFRATSTIYRPAAGRRRRANSILARADVLRSART